MASSRFGRMGSTKQKPRGLDSALINHKNSNTKWLQQNLLEMEQNVKRIVKSIEDDAYSIGKKLRPESINLVHKCHHMYLLLMDLYIKEAKGPSNFLTNQYSQSCTTTVAPGSKQLKRILSSKYRLAKECQVDLHEYDICKMELMAPLNDDTTIEEQDQTEEFGGGLKLDSLSNNSNNDVSAVKKLELSFVRSSKEDETEDLSSEEEQVVVGETEIHQSIESIPDQNHDIENSNISILEEHVKELTIALEAVNQKHHKLEKYELEGMVSCKVSEINQMKSDILKLRLVNADLTAEIENAQPRMKEELKMVVETERRSYSRMSFGILTGISVAGISIFLYSILHFIQLRQLMGE